MGKTIRASALVMLLACSAHAGWMHNDRTQPPPPPPSTQSVQEPTAEEQDAVMEVQPDTLLVRIALSVIALL